MPLNYVVRSQVIDPGAPVVPMLPAVDVTNSSTGQSFPPHLRLMLMLKERHS
jgi:hypothetical protein